MGNTATRGVALAMAAVAGLLPATGLATQATSPLAPVRLPAAQALPTAPVIDAVAGPVHVLPPVPGLDAQHADTARPGLNATVRKLKFRGNTVLHNDKLIELSGLGALPVIVDDDALRLMLDRITRAYIELGYVSSGATLPDQTLDDGTLTIDIVEGRLDGGVEIAMRTATPDREARLHTDYVRRQLDIDTAEPLNVHALNYRLQLLQLDPRIASVDARLEHGRQPGQAHLSVDITEQRGLTGRIGVDNHQSPALGSWVTRANLSHHNLSGRGDSVSVGLEYGEGLRSIALSYDRAIAGTRARLGVQAGRIDSEVIEAPFGTLDINGDVTTGGVYLLLPGRRSLTRSLDHTFLFDYRRSRSSLLGQGFSFGATADDGHYVVSALRIRQDWMQRSLRSVFSARSTLSLGLNAFGSTVHNEPRPDSRFISWLGQVQWAWQANNERLQVISRLDLQLSNDGLPGLEQFALGGHATVRGYRENSLVRDNGWLLCAEARYALLDRGSRRFEVALFADTARAWDDNRSSAGESLTGAGLGLRYAHGDTWLAQLYWAQRFSSTPPIEAHDLQDDGLHLRVSSGF